MAGLFDIPTTCGAHEVFPDECEVDYGHVIGKSYLRGARLREVLTTLGFIVGGVRTHSSSELRFPVGTCEVDATLIEVAYPKGWVVLLYDHARYMHDYNAVRQIVDGEGRLRGVLSCGPDLLPVSGELYLRYAVLRSVELNFSELRKQLPEKVHSVVIDRSKVRPEEPWVYPPPIYVNTRNLLEEAYPQLSGMSSNARRAWISANVPKEAFARLVLRDGSVEWLDEQYPQWRDPAAYW